MKGCFGEKRGECHDPFVAVTRTSWTSDSLLENGTEAAVSSVGTARSHRGGTARGAV